MFSYLKVINFPSVGLKELIKRRNGVSMDKRRLSRLMYSLALRETGEVRLYGDAKQVAPFCFVPRRRQQIKVLYSDALSHFVIIVPL